MDGGCFDVKCARKTHSAWKGGGTHSRHPGGSVGSSSVRPAPSGLPRSSAPPRCLSSPPGFGWCWRRWTSCRCPAGTRHLERDKREEGGGEKKKKGRTGQTFPSPHSLFMQQYHLLPTCCGKRRAWGGVEEKSGLKGRRQRWLDVSRLEGV